VCTALHVARSVNPEVAARLTLTLTLTLTLALTLTLTLTALADQTFLDKYVTMCSIIIILMVLSRPWP